MKAKPRVIIGIVNRKALLSIEISSEDKFTGVYEFPQRMMLNLLQDDVVEVYVRKRKKGEKFEYTNTTL